MSDDQTTVAPVDDTRHDTGQQQSEQPVRGSNSKVGGSTGTGIAAPETGYPETGQLPDDAAPPVVKHT